MVGEMHTIETSDELLHWMRVMPPRSIARYAIKHRAYMYFYGAGPFVPIKIFKAWIENLPPYKKELSTGGIDLPK